jgi:hypothetical protein
MGGEDYCFRDLAPHIDGRILLTGFHGDKIWDLHTEPNATIARGDISGSSLQEFSLSRNFINIPVPMIGSRRHFEVAAISQNKEMIPYRLNNHYDRPIPRRLLEETGVARELFGQKKKAVSILFFSKPESLPQKIRQTRKQLVPVAGGTHAKILLRCLVWRTRFLLYRVANRAALVFPWNKGITKWLVGDWRIFEHHHPQAVLDFLGGVALTRRRYSISAEAHKFGSS